MPREAKHKAGKYSIYPNGYVYIGNAFKFIISDEREFDYVFRGGKKTSLLEDLLDGFPESLSFIHKEPLAPPFQENIDLTTKTEKIMATGLHTRLVEIAEGTITDKYIRDRTIAEALLAILK